MATIDPDLKQLLQSQAKLIEVLSERLGLMGQPVSATDTASVDYIARNISEFLYDPDAGVTFDSWYKRYEDIFTVELAQKDDATKVRLLLRKLGPAEHARYRNFILPDDPSSRSFTSTIDTLTKVFGDSLSLFHTRFRCLQISKRDVDDFVQYAGIVNRECSQFKLGSLTEDQFRCLVFICGLQSPGYADLRTRLLAMIDQDPKTTLAQLVDECQRLTNLKRDSALIQQSDRHPRSVNLVSTPHHSTVTRSSPAPTGSGAPKPPSACRHCGAWHFHRHCPHRNNRCTRCQKVGHKNGFCQSKKPRRSKSKSNRPRPPVAQSGVRSYGLAATFKLAVAERRKYITVLINDHPVRMQLDTASDISIISEQTWRSLGSPAFQPSSFSATSASGGSLQLTGQLHCRISFRNTTIDGVCYLNEAGLDLLGIDWLDDLGLTALPIDAICCALESTHVSDTMAQTVTREFATVFADGLGHCTQAQATLTLIEGCTPVFRPRRPVPYAALPLVDAELQRLEKLGILVPVSYSAWAAPIVVVKKANGSLRICADFSTGLNAALKPHCYPLPVPEDLFTILNGGACFAKLDLSEAYFQIEVAPECRQLLTINTHRGLYQFTRLPFGVKTAPAIFQQIMDTMLSGLSGTAAYLDDILVVGRSPDELYERVSAVLRRIQDYGFRLRAEKCQFFLRSIKYLGFIFNAKGRQPDPENVRAIQKMPPPTDITTLRSFLGLVSYYSAFLPALHDIRAPLNRLLEKEREWVWSPDCQAAFEKLKRTLTSDLLLTHYDPQLPVVLAADASNNGVGAVISHTFPDGSEKAIAHASRTLTAAERNYGQIEKEALAIVFGLKKFHKFLFGRHFTLLTDHKPLLSVFGSKKGIPVHSANRLVRWSTLLLAYDFDIRYRRTTEFGQADALSRLIARDRTADEDVIVAAVSFEQDVNRAFNDAIRGLPITAADIRRETAKDDVLRKAIHFTRTKWPCTRLTNDLLHLSRRKQSLSVLDSCLMDGDRVVVPTRLRPSVLRQFHSGHPGIGRMKAVARSYAYWPGMDADIEQFVQNCSRCQAAAKHPPQHQPIPWDPPTKPWSRLHIDFAGPIDGVMYLVVVDAYSKWPEVIPLQPATASSTISALHRLCAQHGLPEMIVSDNGSQFTSSLFADFCRRNSINHVHSPPYHPQSNGQAERFVDTFKRALLKARGEEKVEDVMQQFLLAYRSTPNPATPERVSPAEALMGRRLRTQHHALLPSAPTTTPSTTKDKGYQPGTKVYVRDYRPGQPKWVAGTVFGRRGKVTYEVSVSGDKWVRHYNQIRARYTNNTDSEVPEVQLPLEILLETFGLPTADVAPPSSGNQQLPPRRCTNRKRRPVRPLQLNPNAKSYD